MVRRSRASSRDAAPSTSTSPVAALASRAAYGLSAARAGAFPPRASGQLARYVAFIRDPRELLTTSDETLAAIVDEAQGEASCVGVALSGSRARGAHDAESDYDVYWVLTDEAYGQRKERGGVLHEKQPLPGGLLDRAYTCPRDLAQAAERPGWWTPGLARARVVLDKTGEVEAAFDRFRQIPAEQADALVREELDSYLNSFYRSLKAWRRGNELAGRVEASASLVYLVRALFALERRWAPYPSGLPAEIGELEAAQGWPPGALSAALLAIARTGDPREQQALERRVDDLVRRRGVTGVVESWGGEMERVRAFRFGG